MVPSLPHHLQAIILGPNDAKDNVLKMLNSWGDDTFDFVRHQAPRIVGVFIIAFILTRLLKLVSRRLSQLQHQPGTAFGDAGAAAANPVQRYLQCWTLHHRLCRCPSGFPLLGINMGPLLASAGIAGVAIGFGAQTLVNDFINGFFILVENQYDIGDVIKIAGVQGTVELMTLRRTVLRDADGTVHNVPSSQITVVSNLTRDWTQLALHISVGLPHRQRPGDQAAE